jgi:DNA polymerase (family X)
VNARLAGELGIKIPISTDSHEVAALDHMPLGVAQARRAWLTKGEVLNTRTWPQIARLLNR